MVYGPVIIALAITAFSIYHGATTAAVEWFVNTCTAAGYKMPKDRLGFIRLWGPRGDAHGHIDSHAHNAGRRSKLTPPMVERAYKGIIDWKENNRGAPYASHKELAEECPEVAAVLRESGVSIRTLIKAIKAVHPKFVRAKLTIRHTLTDAHKAARKKECTTLLSKPPRDKHLVVFIDAKSINMSEQARYGWVDLSVGKSIEGVKPATHKGKIITLKYYAAVNALLGPVLLTFYTGTSGMDHDHSGKHYQVSSELKQLGCTPLTHISHHLLQVGLPLRAQGALRHAPARRSQPHHHKSRAHCVLSILHVCILPGCQAAVCAAGLGVGLLVVPLPLHLNQQVGWVKARQIPPLVTRAHAAAITQLPLCILIGCIHLSGICFDGMHLTHQIIQSPLRHGAHARTHAARKRARVVVGSSQRHHSHVPCHTTLSPNHHFVAAAC